MSLPNLGFLGLKCRDKVTGIEGIVESISFDLYGCIHGCLRPYGMKKDTSEPHDARWYDVIRLEILDRTPVLPVPAFGPSFVPPGPADKPTR